MEILWFAILCLMFTLFVILSGWDIGAGTLHFLAARNQEQRSELIAAIGPLWTWNEVWLVAAGGVLFVAFPRVLAIGFPAYYLALFMVLWTLLLRGISIELRGHLPSTLWRSFWDVVFVTANTALAILFGAAIGNVVRGMPLTPETPLSLPLFTDFGVHGMLGILDWYTISIALFTLVCLAAHGSSYLAFKTSGDLYRRVKVWNKRLWILTVCLLLVVSLETYPVRPQLFAGMAARPIAWVALACVAGGLGAVFLGIRSARDLTVLIGSSLFIAGLLGSAAASLFPVILYSTVSGQYSITAYNGASDASSLRAAAYWWPVAAALTFFYAWSVAKHYRGRTRAHDPQAPY